MKILLLLALFAPELWGAACCGGGSLFPSLISGDERIQLTATTSYSNVLGDAPVSGTWVRRAAGDGESRTTFRVDFASLLSDRWQWGAFVPLVRRARFKDGAQSQSFGLGDLGFVIGYEALPSWTYSRWRPKGLVFLSVGVPTGRSPFDTAQPFQVDVTGKGYWNISVGTLLQKTWADWDALLVAEVHQPLGRTLDWDVGVFHLSPSTGASALLGIGRSLGNWRLGASMGLSYDGPLRTTGAIESVSASQSSFPLTGQLSYLIADGMTLATMYTDTRLFAGNNVPVSQTLTALFQTRWDR